MEENRIAFNSVSDTKRFSYLFDWCQNLQQQVDKQNLKIRNLRNLLSLVIERKLAETGDQEPPQGLPTPVADK